MQCDITADNSDVLVYVRKHMDEGAQGSECLPIADTMLDMHDTHCTMIF